jgi:serine/threonine protein kinase/class 3 adenylate cyclase
MAQNQIEELLNARAQIDEQLRRHKNVLTVLFTDVVGSTSYFERFGDTAGLAMVHLSAELGSTAVEQYGGTVVKTIGDSVMAEFPNPIAAVRSAVTMQRRLIEMNAGLNENKRLEIRIGIHSGLGFRKGNDVFGDVVNLAARITKRTAAAQILVSRAVQDAIAGETDFSSRWLDKCTIDGRHEKEDVFVVIWTEIEIYSELRRKLSSAELRVKPQGETGLPSRYKILGNLGSGGVGIVYKVRDLETTEILALKVLKPEIAEDPIAQANFNKELCLARKITHKNVCRIYDLHRSEAITYASMEHVSGENLLNRLSNRGRLSVKESTEILKQICAGLREAHFQGIIHRDLKPANIMIDQAGVVKIMDFGIARLIEKETGNTGSITGTPAYMAPEQAAGERADARTDIYALGLVLYEMVTGVPAFKGDTAIAIALKHITEPPVPPREFDPTLPKNIEHIILKCLQKNPADRFQTVAELEQVLSKPSQIPPMVRAEIKSGPVVAKTARIQALLSSAGSLVSRAREFGKESGLKDRFKHSQQRAKTFLQQPMPKSVSIGKKKFKTEQVLALGVLTAAVLVLSIASVSYAKRSRVNNSQPVKIQTVGGVPAVPQAVPHEISIAKASTPAEVSTRPAVIPTPPVTDSPIVGISRPQPHKKDPIAGSSKNLRKQSAPVAPVLLTPTPNQSVAIVAPVVPSTLEASSDLENRADTSGNTTPRATDTLFEVGSFKDAKLADDAANTLRALGYPVHVLHKGRLWMNAYHVAVGPYNDADHINAARLSLEARGYTLRLTH